MTIDSDAIADSPVVSVANKYVPDGTEEFFDIPTKLFTTIKLKKTTDAFNTHRWFFDLEKNGSVLGVCIQFREVWTCYHTYKGKEY